MIAATVPTLVIHDLDRLEVGTVDLDQKATEPRMGEVVDRREDEFAVTRMQCHIELQDSDHILGGVAVTASDLC